MITIGDGNNEIKLNGMIEIYFNELDKGFMISESVIYEAILKTLKEDFQPGVITTNRGGKEEKMEFGSAKELISKIEKDANEKIIKILNSCEEKVVIGALPATFIEDDRYPISLTFEKRDSLSMYSGLVFGG